MNQHIGGISPLRATPSRSQLTFLLWLLASVPFVENVLPDIINPSHFPVPFSQVSPVFTITINDNGIGTTPSTSPLSPETIFGIVRAQSSTSNRTVVTTVPVTVVAMTTQRPIPSRKKCPDEDMNCYAWVAKEAEKCNHDEYIRTHCRRACQSCGAVGNMSAAFVEKKYDLRVMPPSLQKLAFLIGRWKSEFGGKADFPTIPRFTYGEKLDFSLSTLGRIPVINYTAFAWDNSDLTELHSENGFLAGVEGNSSKVALNTVMSNGFVTVEEGEEQDNAIRLVLERIGRIHFSRDLPVRKMIREWTLLNVTHLEARLIMGTSTHRMMLHTQIIYTKIYP